MSAQTPDFDRVARVYRWAEYAALGPLLWRARTHFLPRLAGRRAALLLGDGDGRFTAKLLRTNAALSAMCVDGSANMLKLLRRRCSFAGQRLTTQQASLLDANIERAPDLVVTHFVLDCFMQADAERLVSTMARTLQPGALWVVSDFGKPRGAILAACAAVYVRLLYAAFRLLTNLRTQQLPDVERAFVLAGFHRVARRDWLRGFVYAELWQRDYNQEDAPVDDGRAPGPAMSFADVHDRPAPHLAGDALPDPEPAAPSLPQPDPGVFHHDPATPPKDPGPSA